MADEVQGDAAAKAKGSGKMFAIMIVALLMIGEGAAVFFLAKSLGGAPVPTEGADVAEDEGEMQPEFGEIELAKCRPSNKMSGKLIVFQMLVSGLVAPSDLERAKALTKANCSRILDRVNYIIRSAELQHLNEPGLETIKRRLKKEFDRIFSDDELIKEVLIPELLQSGRGI